MSTSGRIHSEFLRLLYFLADRQASDYFTVLGYEPHKEEFCHRRGVYFHQHRCTIGMACAQAAAIRGVPTSRADMLLSFVPCNYALLSTIGSVMTSTSVSELKF